MLNQKNITLLGSNALFFSVVCLLFFFPAWMIVMYPMLAAVFFWNDWRAEDELQVLFLFMSLVLGLILISRIHEYSVQLGLGVEMLGIILISQGMGLHRRHLVRERRHASMKTQELEAEIRDMERDLTFYDAFVETANTQIHLRRDLTEAAKSLGNTLDPGEVQTRLVRVLEKRYPKSRIRIMPGQPSDPLVNWVVENRGSVLVKDSQHDERFSGAQLREFSSAMVAPLWVLKHPFGFLRVEDDRPSAFRSDDLRTVDLYTTLASLTLENIQFLHNVNDLATHDPLTQLYTHRAFQMRLEEEILRSGRSQQPLSLVMCDVDHFKRYNDTYGHQAGDLLLKTVAGLLAHGARPVDFVARYGGEEFAIILPGVEHDQGVGFADQLRGRVAEESFLFQGKRTGVTMSFGVASFPKDSTTSSQIVRAADERLYRAKHGGRNQVVG